MMVVAMARLLRDGERVFHGVASPLPMIAILLAQRLHAPNLVYINITGGINALPETLPRTTVDPRLTHGSHVIFKLAEIFDMSARGDLDTAFLSGVQIDGAGRINMSVIGPYERPKVRLPGGAGSAAILPTARRTLLWRTRHDPRTFVEELAFVTAAGNVDRVVTPLCIFVKREGRLQLESIHPYSSAEEVRAQTGFKVETEGVPLTPAPTTEELAALHAIDPQSVRLIEFKG
ncbi:CoA-transferase [Ktedonosporobacter rubrisoli]|uniref:CoA-transferase n=2 Tax=Ktedonosporobacter rubrisoli TaxID=2509675 RepID=A0A4P6K7I7_KTERU|nr:CoA-transferase [Ktedonosporobacter rubrisoli]